MHSKFCSENLLQRDHFGDLDADARLNKQGHEVVKWIHLKMRVFWDIAPCSLVGVDRHFRGTYCFHHQRDESPTKRRSVSVRLHGAISQVTVIFIKKNNSNFLV
jgi:hypothetical protein